MAVLPPTAGLYAGTKPSGRNRCRSGCGRTATRDVAGTGADSHVVTAVVYDHSAGTYLDYSYSKTMYELPTVDDGSTVRTGKSLQDADTVPAKFLRGENS